MPTQVSTQTQLDKALTVLEYKLTEARSVADVFWMNYKSTCNNHDADADQVDEAWNMWNKADDKAETISECITVIKHFCKG